MDNYASYLRPFRILPNRIMEPGWVSWCTGEKIISYEKLMPDRQAPEEADTVLVSIEDYWRISTMIANAAV